MPWPLSIFPRLSVAENIVMGGWQAEKRFFISKQSTERTAEAVMSRWGLNFGGVTNAAESQPASSGSSWSPGFLQQNPS